MINSSSISAILHDSVSRDLVTGYVSLSTSFSDSLITCYYVPHHKSKDQSTILLSMSLPNMDLFSKFFTVTPSWRLALLSTSNVPAQGWEHSPLRNGLGVTAAAACYGTYAREISLLVLLLLTRGQQE